MYGKRKQLVEDHGKDEKWLNISNEMYGKSKIGIWRTERSTEVHGKSGLVYEEVDGSNEAYRNVAWCMKKWM